MESSLSWAIGECFYSAHNKTREGYSVLSQTVKENILLAYFPVAFGSRVMVTSGAFFSSLFISILFPIVVKLREEAERIFVIKQSLCECMNQLQAWTQCTQSGFSIAGIPVSPYWNTRPVCYFYCWG